MVKRTRTKIRVVALPSARLAPFAGLPSPYEIEFLGDWDSLFSAIPRLSASGVVLVDCTPAGPQEQQVTARLWELLRDFPSVAVVAAVDATIVAPELIRVLFDQGVSDVLDLSLESTPGLAVQRLGDAHARPFKRRFEEALNRYPSARARTIMRAAAHVAASGGGANDLAEQFGVSPETVAAWCTSAALPPPRSLQTWMRVLLAALLLQDQSRTAADIAAACGLSSDRTLRRAFNRSVGVDVRTLRGAQAFHHVMSAFNAELARCRESRRTTTGMGAR